MQIAEHELNHDEGIKGIQGMEAKGDKAEVPEVPEVPKNTNVVESAGFDGRLFSIMFVFLAKKQKNGG